MKDFVLSFLVVFLPALVVCGILARRDSADAAGALGRLYSDAPMEVRVEGCLRGCYSLGASQVRYEDARDYDDQRCVCVFDNPGDQKGGLQ